MLISNNADLEKALIESYQFYFRHRGDRGHATVDGIYWTGKCDGAVEALGAIYLAVFGGEKMMDLWKLTLPEEE